MAGTTFLLLLFKLAIIYGQNNICQPKKNEYDCIEKEYGCEDGTYALNSENKNPVRGVCLPSGYDKNQRPNVHGITNVSISINHQKILEVHETEKTFEVDVKISFIWEDNRIRTALKEGHDYIKMLPDTKLPDIWNPDFNVGNMKKAMPVNAQFVFSELRIFKNSTISSGTTVLNITKEFRVTVFCEFRFKNFPFDIQKCRFQLSSRDPETLHGYLYDPSNTLHLTKEYESDGFDVTITFRNYTNGIVGFDIELKRLMYASVYQYYLPCFAIVVVSFISFIIPLSAIPGRVALVVTQFLTLTNIFIHQMVSYI